MDFIYQTNPIGYTLEYQCFRPVGWKDTLEGYGNEANQRANLVLLNEELRTTKPKYWAFTIAVEVELSIATIKCIQSKLTRCLRSFHMVATGAIEPTKENTIHWHLLVISEHTKSEWLIIKSAIHNALGVACNCSVKPLLTNADVLRWVRYIYKASHPEKRLMFTKGSKLHKTITINERDFWVVPMPQLIAEQSARAKAFVEKEEARLIPQQEMADFNYANNPELLPLWVRCAEMAYPEGNSDWHKMDKPSRRRWFGCYPPI